MARRRSYISLRQARDQFGRFAQVLATSSVTPSPPMSSASPSPPTNSDIPSRTTTTRAPGLTSSKGLIQPTSSKGANLRALKFIIHVDRLTKTIQSIP